MDEPSSGLDQYETERFGAILRGIVDERGVGIVLVEHEHELGCRCATTSTCWDFGQKIFEGTPEQVRNSPVVRDAYLGSEDLGSEDLGSEDLGTGEGGATVNLLRATKTSAQPVRRGRVCSCSTASAPVTG